MTFAPPTLQALAELWVAQGGVNLGIVGDTSHIARGWSYHLGADNLADGASSARTARDRAGLSNAASALDLGKLAGSFVGLRAFSTWLVAQGRANAPGTRDIREVIYSPDGKVVLQWDRERGVSSAPVQLDATPLNLGHLTHTHISWYRDAEFRDHRPVFAPYFEEDLVNSFPVPKGPAIGDVAKGVVLYTSDALVATDPNRVILDPARTLPYLGRPRVGALIVELVDPAGVHSGTAYFVKAAELTNIRPLPAPTAPTVDCAPAIKTAVDAANAASALLLSAKVAAEHERTRSAAIAAVEAI